MCDIMLALPDSTLSGRVVFAKNSDRPAGECQILYDSRDEERPGKPVRCAFVEVPEDAAPLRTIGCRPYWCWGYETGFNEAGVVGGNTAVYTRSFWEDENRREFGLTGMELLRFGLERARTAADAVRVIAELLGRYGQWAPAVWGKGPPEGCYENAFLLADKGEAWILETAGRRWAARRFDKGTVALSNQLTIRNEWTIGSEDLLDHAESRGWWSLDRGPLDFALAYSDHEHYARQVSHIRWARARELLERAAGRIDAAVMMACLRDHYEGTFLRGPQFNEFSPDFLTLCMHQSPAGFTWGNTATSVVVEIDPDAPESSISWCCYQPPCSSTYVAFSMDGGLPPTLSSAGTAGLRSESPVSAPEDSFHEDSLWWRMYRILDAVATAPPVRRDRLRSLFDSIEERFHGRVASLRSLPDRSARVRAITEQQLSDVRGVIERLEHEWNL
jgi:secernin